MSACDDGGPAFPIPGLQDDADFNGMSLRDYFAAQAMAGFLAQPGIINPTQDAALAYRMADAMLKAREA